MSQRDELSELLAAERAEARPASEADQVWRNIEGALQADAPALAVAHGPLKLGLTLVGKSTLIPGVIAFVVTSAGLGVYSSVQSAPPAAPRPLVSTASPAPAISVTAAAEPPKEAPTSAPSPSTRVTSASPTASEQASSTLAEELRLLKAAKAELNARRPHLAVVWLDQHAQRYPRGVLRAERDGLKVLVACEASPAAGQPGARRFVAQNPQSALADHISRACRLTPDPAHEKFTEETER